MKQTMSSRITNWWKRFRAGPKASPLPAGTSRQQMTDIFGQIYQGNVWGSAESVSGQGSTLARAADFRDPLMALLKQLQTRVLLDAPCGDFHWAQPVADAVEQYIGLDVVPDLIAHLQQANLTPRRRFQCLDLTCETLPQADLILCRDALVHFSFSDIWRGVHNFQRSGARYLLTTTFIDRAANDDIVTGQWRPLNLQARPFRFPPPIALVDEKCTHSGGIYKDKRLALWELAQLPSAVPALS